MPFGPVLSRSVAKPIRMILIDDHPIVREGICALLALESDMTIVGDAGDMDTGIELVRRHKPDLVICDLTMPGCTGTIAVRKLCRECPDGAGIGAFRARLAGMHPRIIRGRRDRLRAQGCIARGSSDRGAPCRDGCAGDLPRRQRNGDAQLAARSGNGAGRRQCGRSNRRTGKILRLIALGVPTWRIAADLRRGVKVVEKYRANLMRRLNLSSTAAVARYAVSCNLLSREEVDQLVSAE